jgi:hypothetical protein
MLNEPGNSVVQVEKTGKVVFISWLLRPVLVTENTLFPKIVASLLA